MICMVFLAIENKFCAPRVRRETFLQLCSEREESDVARPFDRLAQPALVARAGAGHAARQNFAAILNELVERIGFLVVNEINFAGAEMADLPLAEELALASARRAAGATGSAPTFARASAIAARRAGMRAATAARAISTGASMRRRP
jgi:hypothetical protein